MGDGRELSFGGSKAMSIASYGGDDDDSARDAALTSAVGDAPERVCCLMFAQQSRVTGLLQLAAI